MYIKTLNPGDKVKIYMAGGAIGQGVRGKVENIVEVIWHQTWRGVGMAKFGDGTPVSLPLNDGDIVMSEPINTIKNAFWDAGINVILLNSSTDGENASCKFEVVNYGAIKSDVLIISSVDGYLYNITDKETTELGNKKEYNELVKSIKDFYKH